MGNLVGHVVPGLGFLIIGLWQLYNHIKLHCRQPKLYSPPIWFPAPRLRHLELYLIIFGGSTYIFTEIFVGPSSHHHPLDPTDWTIPTNHLHNFEHATITLAMLVYALFTLHFDRVRPRATHALSLLLVAGTFAVELLVFYLHSTDHTGFEWQYHWLLQTIISASLLTTVLGISHPRSFAVGFTRSVSVVFQGLWLIMIGVMLYTPRFIPKGCSLQSGDGMLTVPCDGPEAVHRAKALVNLQFAWSLLAVLAFSVWFYLHLTKRYPEVPEYACLGMEEFPASPKKERGEDKSGRSLVDMKWPFELEPKDLER